MPITLNDLTIDPSGVEMDELLSSWKWAMPETLRPVLLTAMGDVFAQGDSGSVYIIDTVEGSVSPIASSGEEFQSLLGDMTFVTQRLFPSRVVQMRKAEILLGPNQVYSHKLPLALGGEDDVENVEPTDVAVHVGISGQIHQQIKELPEGTPISEIKIE